MPGLPKRDLHELVLDALGPSASSASHVEAVPLLLSHPPLGNLAFYCFTMTGPPGGRPTGEYKIQLIVPGQKRSERGYLSLIYGAFPILLGWSADDLVFALWDAYLHLSFAYSQNVQVKGEAVWRARTAGLSTSDRRLHDSVLETVVLGAHDRLSDAIAERIHLSARRVAES
jgi:hypothetical protein